MKNSKLKNTCYLLLATCILLSSCSDEFLSEKRPYGSYGPEQVYYDETSVNLRLNYIYQKSLPFFKAFSETTDNRYPDMWPIGGNDFLSCHTEEFGGYGTWQTPGKELDNTNIQKFFFYGINESPWKKIRECNDVIVRLFNTENSVLTEEVQHKAASQARFFRATRYFRLWKRYGGLPITDSIQSTLQSDSSSLQLYRTSTEETYQFMQQDLEYAAKYLPTRWDEEANNWGRITSGAALALAGYIANYYASPLFNRTNDRQRWQQAYDLNKRAIAALDEGGFGLSYESDPGTNASSWAKIWTNMMGGETNASEAVFLAICNNRGGDDDDQLYNCWESAIRPKNIGGDGMQPTAEMVDLFPMADGKRPTEMGEYTYDKTVFFLNRDPRFYRTFAFPGTEWQFYASAAVDTTKCPYLSATAYKLQNYSWYKNLDEYLDTVKTGYFSDMMGTSGQSIYIRKKSQDYALSKSYLYNYDNDSYFQINGQPCIYMRYTEVLLNLAEAACGIGNYQEAYDILKRIRQRVGYTDECGLDAAILTDQAKMFEAILYERQIELAYEGKRFDDCHRWMLFDGGATQTEIDGAPSSWALSGWGGNTCTYLGVQPLNETRLHYIEMTVDPNIYTAEQKADYDPFTKGVLTLPEALTLNEDFRTVAPVNEGDETTYNDAKVKALAQFYMANLIRKDVCTMASTEEDNRPIWQKNCYFLGLGSGDQTNNPNVAQEIGWKDYYGGSGVFDPLSETPAITPR